MRQSAADYARTVRAIVVGAGSFASSTLPPLDARIDAESVSRALTDASGCGIPNDQVSLLTDRSATRAAILAALVEQVAASRPGDTLVVYFSGHGLLDGDEFHVLVHDGRVSASEIAAACAQHPFRGVLLIADCCNGAAFAASAPDFFRDLGHSQFRIALFASRSGQRAWDLGDGRGSLFSQCLVRVLNGDVATGAVPGEITYFGLAETLKKLIDESLSLEPHLERQETVATVSATGDPLLFVNARQAMRQLSVETDRVSRAYMRQRIARLLIFTLGAAIMAPILVAGWASIYHYAEVVNDETVLNRGYPGVQLLGLPIEVARLPYGEDAFASTSPLARDEPVIALNFEALLESVRGQRNLALRAWALASEDKRAEAWDLLRTSQAPGSTHTEALSDSAAIMLNALRYRLWMPERTERLAAMTRSENAETRHAAMLRLLERDPAHAYRLLAQDAARPKLDHREVLLNSSGGCSAEMLTYFEALASSAELLNVRYHLLMAWADSGCPLSGSSTRRMANALDLDALAFLPEFIESLGSSVAEVLEDPALPLPRRLALLAAWSHAPCDYARNWSVAGSSLLARTYYGLHVSRHCPDAVVTTTVRGAELVTEIASSSSLAPDPKFVIRFSGPVVDAATPDAVAFLPLSALLLEREQRSAGPFLLLQASRGDINNVSWRALRTLRKLGVQFSSGQVLVRGANDRQHTLEYHLWQATSAPDETHRIAAERAGDSRWPYVAEYFASTAPNSSIMSRFEYELSQPIGPRTIAIAEILAIYGGFETLDVLSAHSDPAVRKALLDYAVLNPHFESWLRAQKKPFLEPFSSREALRRLTLLEELERTPASPRSVGRCWRISAALNRGQLPLDLGDAWPMPPGTRLRLARTADALRCRTPQG